jgi:hypothetical protein
MPRRAQVQVAATHPLFDVVADGTGIVSHAGAALLADSGDCVSDLRALAAQPDLLGTVASVSTAWRVVAEEVATDPRGVPRIWSALARTRTRAWALGAAPTGPLVIDLDATPVKVHSDKQAARPTFKQGFGFHRLLAFLDAAMGLERRWRECCGQATPGPTPPPTTWPSSAWRWPHCPGPRATGRSRSAPTPLARPRLRRRAHPARPAILGRVRPHRAAPPGDPGRGRGPVAASHRHRRPPTPRRTGGRACHPGPCRLAPGTRAICRRERPTPAPATR